MSVRKELERVNAEMVELCDEIDAIGGVAQAENRDLTDDEVKTMEGNRERFEKLETRAGSLTATLNIMEKSRASRVPAAAAAARDALQTQRVEAHHIAIEARGIKPRVFNRASDAYASGMWILATVFNRTDAKKWVDSNRQEVYGALEEGTDNLGGYTVPKPLAQTIIVLVERYGVFRRNAMAMPMSSATLDVPSYLDGPTVYYPGEGQTITASDLTFGQVNLVATKYAAMVAMSTEVSEDSVINLAELVAEQIARKFAYAEDLNSFLGDGSATYGGIEGIQTALKAGSKITLAGDITGLALADLNGAVGLLPQYEGINPKWYCNSYVYFTAMLPLLQQLGGTDQTIVEGAPRRMFLGYEVEFAQVLPKGDGLSEMAIVFGDLRLGAYSGQRRDLTIKQYDQVLATTDQLAIIATMRADSKIHSTGTVTEPGAIIAIETAAVLMADPGGQSGSGGSGGAAQTKPALKGKN